jgi:hypothetical protein
MGLPPRLFRSSSTEEKGTQVSVSGVPGVVAVFVEHCVLGAVAFEDLADVIASGHVPTSELAALPRPRQRSITAYYLP